MRFLLLVLFFAPVASFAQDGLQYVVSNSGGDFKTTGLAVSWTIGEVSSETLVSLSYILSQGFHQGNLEVEETNIELPASMQIRVYPNPVEDILHFETEDFNKEFRIVDIDGRIRITGHIISSPQEIDCTSLPVGTFFLQIDNQSTHKIVKH